MDNQTDKCEFCHLVFTDRIKWNDYNRNSHINSCKKRISFKTMKLDSFFKKVEKKECSTTGS